MTRLRFILVSFFAAVAALFGRRKEKVRGLHVKTYTFTALTNNEWTAAGNRTGKSLRELDALPCFWTEKYDFKS